MTTPWDREPVWFHGDVASGNLLVRDARLAAVLDFGSSGVGDPACDTVIAWTFFSGASRATFRATLDVDSATWSRGRGWALWTALISLSSGISNATRRTQRWRDATSTRSSPTTRKTADAAADLGAAGAAGLRS